MDWTVVGVWAGLAAAIVVGAVLGYRKGRLPLRLSDTFVQHRWEGMPSRNVVQLLLTARVDGYLVQLDGYFGTQHPPPERVAVLQRELDSLVIPPGPTGAPRTVGES